MKDKEILDTYHGLWKIEETFKITKSTLETRPVYVSLKNHIESHFLTCFILTLIEKNLISTNSVRIIYIDACDAGDEIL